MIILIIKHNQYPTFACYTVDESLSYRYTSIVFLEVITMTDEHELLTTAQAAKRLRVSSPTLVRWRLTGKGPDFVLVGRRLYYTPAMLSDWLASQRRAPTRPPETTP
jgi:hypothetical protein